MPKRSRGGFRLDLGEPLAAELTDFCKAKYRNKTELIRQALKEYLDKQLDAAAKERREQETKP